MSERRLAWLLAAPALAAMAVVALAPLGWALWESLHLNDLRMPWRGRPLVGLDNYAELAGDPRFGAALAHTLVFTVLSLALELLLGLALALLLDARLRARALVRALVLAPWAIPTVVTALAWRFMFEGRQGLANSLLALAGRDEPATWFLDPVLAWVPIVLADVWKTAPFVALLLLAGLQQIDQSLYEAARVDGAGPARVFRHVTLPLLRPALLVALVFRALDAVRVFDLIYVMTGGGPGTATEPLALYVFTALFQHLRFGFGSALAVMLFLLAALLALLLARAARAPGRESAG